MSVPTLDLCMLIGQSNVSCHDVCQGRYGLEPLFDPTKVTNLINCGLWRTAAQSVALGGSSQTTWMQNKIAKMFQSVGFDFPMQNNKSGVSVSVLRRGRQGRDSTQYFGSSWTLLHPNQPTVYNGVYFHQTTKIVPTPCDAGLIIDRDAWQYYFPVCIAQLCESNGWLNSDIGGIGVRVPG